MAGVGAQQNTVRYFYDDIGQLVKVVDAAGVVVDYVYDPVGNIIEIRRSTVTGLAIFSVTPSRGPVGSVVQIHGQNFDPAVAGNAVAFNGIAAAVSAATPTALTVTVPIGATTGPITVTVGGMTAVTGFDFTVLQIPVITSVTPDTASPEDAIPNLQATGANLTGSTFEFLGNAPGIIVNSTTVDPSGTSATLDVTVSDESLGTYVLVATNPNGSSNTASAPGNTLTVAIPMLVPDVPANGEVNPVRDVDLFTFTLNEPTRVVVQGTPTGFNPCLRLLTDVSTTPVAGGTICASFTGQAARLDLTLAAGTYFVEVSDSGNDQTGAYTLLYQPVVVASAVPLVADVPANEMITPRGDLDLYRFALTGPTRVVLQGTPNGFNPCLRLLTDVSTPPVAGGTICGSFTNQAARLDLTLAAGTYFVEVSDSGNDQTGAYTLLYQPVVVASAVPVIADVPANEMITPLGDLDLYRFTLTEPTRIVLQGTPTGFNPCLRLLTDVNTPPVAGGTICASFTGQAARLDLTLAAGTYFVEVSDSGNDQTGAYTLLYQPVVVASAVPVIADVPANETITPLGDLDLYRFTLTEPTRIVLQGTPTGFNPCLRLLTDVNTPPVAGGTICASFTGQAARLDLTLAAGTYFVEVSDSGNDQTGAYTLLYQPVVVASAVPLIADVPANETITPLGDLDFYRFTLTEPTRIVLQGTPTGFNPCLRLLTDVNTPPVAGGTICASFTGQAARLDLTLAAGTYFVEVSDSGNDQTGAYTLLYQPVVVASAVPLVADVPANEMITPRGDLDLYRFTLTEPTRVVLQGTPTGFNPCLRLLTDVNTPPVAGGTICASFTGQAARLDLTLAAGTYFVEVSDSGNDQTGAYTLLYQPTPIGNALPLAGELYARGAAASDRTAVVCRPCCEVLNRSH